MTIPGRRRGEGRPPRVPYVLRQVKKKFSKRPQQNKRMRWRRGP